MNNYNDYNNNFLDNNQFNDTSSEVFEEIYEEYEEEIAEAEAQAVVLSEALKRIQQAKLYEALLNHQLFSPGSASPEIIKIVSKEFKDFILSRLENLLGIKQEKQQVSSQQSFNDQEINALKAISRRLIEKDSLQQVQTPVTATQVSIQTALNSQAPVITPVQAQSEPQLEIQQTEPKRVIKRVVKKVSKQPSLETSRSENKAPRAKTQNIGAVSGQDLGQVSSPERPPMKMPSASEMDAINARQADFNSSRSSATNLAGSNLTSLVSKLTK